MATQASLDLVQKIYIAYYGRPADPLGQTYWANAIDAANGNAEAVINAFGTSTEATNIYGNLGNPAAVNNLYKQLFGRDADVAGLKYYVDGLNAGTFTLAGIALTIANGATGSDVTTLNAKIAAANAFTAAVDTTAEIIGYAGAAAATEARTQLATVVDAASSTTYVTNVNTNVANVVTTGSNSQGETFTLTQGLDTIAGSNGNDTINAYAFNGVSGADVTTLNSVDTIDGGAGKDTLNIEVKDNPASATDFNGVIQGSIKNVEVININNVAASAAAAVDASKFGAEAQEIWQVGQAGNVSKLAATTTAGFKDIAALNNTVTAAAAATSASVAFNNVTEGGFLQVDAAAGGVLNTVNISGAIVDGADAGTTVTALHTHLIAGKDVQTVTVNSAVDLALDVVSNEGGSTKSVTALNAAGSTGGITYTGGSTAVATITTGSGKDDVTVVTATSKTAGSVVNASVTTNAGNDKVTVNVTGDGNTTIDTGAGDDTVAITGRGTSVLTVNLGDGADTFTSAVAIAATDSIDAGAGSDTLLLSLVGSANVGAFKNFDVYDVKGMTADLDLDILNTNNTVTEIVGSGALGAAVTLQNVGAGVNFRATADMGLANALTVTQKTAGALTVTLDADQATDLAGDDVAQVSVAAAGATSISAVFDAAYDGVAGAGTAGGETAATDNVSTIALATQAAASLSVVSGGANAKNVLNVTEGAGVDALTTVTVTGAQALTLSVSGASKLATIDASAATGGLTATLADLKDGGSIKLGSGVDNIAVTNTSTTGALESIVGIEKAAAVAVSTAAADATAKAAAIADADTLILAGATVANASSVAGGDVNAKGVLVFSGAGPATLDAAIAIASLGAETNGEAVAFQYLNDTYVFVQNATDTVVKLTGITGVTDFVETGVDHFFIV